MKSVLTSEIVVNIWTNNIRCKLYLQDNLSQRIWLSEISRPATACNCSLFRSWFPFPAHFYEGKTMKSWPEVAPLTWETLHDVFAEAAYEKIYWKLKGAAGSAGNPVGVRWPLSHGLFLFNIKYSTIKTICDNTFRKHTELVSVPPQLQLRTAHLHFHNFPVVLNQACNMKGVAPHVKSTP